MYIRMKFAAFFHSRSGLFILSALLLSTFATAFLFPAADVSSLHRTRIERDRFFRIKAVQDEVIDIDAPANDAFPSSSDATNSLQHLQEQNGQLRFDAEAIVSQIKSLDMNTIINTSIFAIALVTVVFQVLSVDIGITRGWSTEEIAYRVPLDNWNSYNAILDAAPIQTKSITSATVYAIGDTIAQRTEGTEIGQLDRGRICRSLAAGLIGHGPLSHYWYQISEDFFNNVLVWTDWWSFIPKVVIDQTLWGPFWNNTYIILLGIMQLQKPAEVWADIKRTTIPLVVSGLKLWPLAHCITYGLVPVENRLLWVDMVEIVWVTILATQAAGSASNTSDENNVVCLYAFAPLQASRAVAVERTIKIRPTLLRVANEVTTIDDEQKSTDTEKKELSYGSILKVIDEGHHADVTEACAYFPEDETQASAVGDVDEKLYERHPTHVLKEETVNKLRSVARNYFEQRGESWGLRDVALDELLSEASEWKHDVDDALTEVIYPLSRCFIRDHPNSSLTVTSATIFVGGGYPGAAVTTTTLERDSGMITAHVDLGTDSRGENETNQQRKAMGGLFLESLAGDAMADATSAVVGPLAPGQVVVHRSIERTAAMIIPSDLHGIEADSKQQNKHLGLDNPTRRALLKTAETARHYCLRLTLSLKNNKKQEEVIKAPAEERSYRLRSFARFRGEDRLRYLTLAGIIDVTDYENHLWLGFDYSARASTEESDVDISQRMSDINKAIFHLQKAQEICPTDARVPFQLANACKLRSDMNQAEQYEDLAEVADALRRSSELESVAVKLGIHDTIDLAICLNGLASTLCKMGEFDQAVDIISRWGECSSIRSSLEPEDLLASPPEPKNIPEFEWIKAGDRNVALTTCGETAVFDEDDIALIRAAADKRFAQSNGSQLSRYSMQYDGNREVHLDDLCKNDPALKERMDKILKEKIYPLVRESFKDQGGNPLPLGALSVYDSIFVRYNGDVARKAGRIGASQPLHQDGGMYSVNIALNAHRSDDPVNGFTGGGTFIEALSIGDNETVRRPTRAGHALLHRTTQKHAGAPTISGIRDILVIFLTARRPETPINDEYTYGIETAMRLQSMAKELTRDKCLYGLELARSYDPMNSEISYWLGMHLLQGDMNDPSDERWEEICRGVETLETAVELNPADARAHYHLGMSISTRHKYAMRTKRAHLLPPPADAASRMIESFEKAVRLEKRCEEAGCENGLNLAAGYLTLGEFMARLRDFDKAVKYLSQVECTLTNAGEKDRPWARDMLEEVQKMMSYCETETAKLNETALLQKK